MEFQPFYIQIIPITDSHSSGQQWNAFSSEPTKISRMLTRFGIWFWQKFITIRNYPFEIVVNWNARSFIWSILASRPFNPNADKWSAWFDYGQGNGRLNRNKFNLNELIGYLFVINEDRERERLISNECCYLNTNTFEYSLHTHWSVCVCFRYPFLLLLVAALLRSIVTQKLDFHVSNTESIR